MRPYRCTPPQLAAVATTCMVAAICLVASVSLLAARPASTDTARSGSIHQAAAVPIYLPDLSRHDTRPRPTALPADPSATPAGLTVTPSVTVTIPTVTPSATPTVPTATPATLTATPSATQGIPTVTPSATATPTLLPATPPPSATPGTATPGKPRPFGTVELKPDFDENGSGTQIDSIGFWEAPDPADTLMLVTAKGNQRVEVWRYPFAGNEQEALRHPIFGTDTKVNGIVVDQAEDVVYIAISTPVSTVAVFDLPGLNLVRHFVDGQVNLRGEPNLALLQLPDASKRLYVSADDIVYLYEPHSGAALGDFRPTKGLETMLGDDRDQIVYIPDENSGTGVYAYDPDGRPFARGGASVFGTGGIFDDDAEGITEYVCSDGEGADSGAGFIVVADQRAEATDFEIFDRQAWDHLGTLRLTGVSNTDGVASTQQALPDYPLGLFAALNDDKSVAGLGWDKILAATGLGCAGMPLPPTATPEDPGTETPTATLAPSATPVPAETDTPAPSHTPDPARTEEPTPTAHPAPAGSRGYLTTPGELAAIMAKADQGIEPHAAAVAELLKWAGKRWDYKLDATEKCKAAGDPKWMDEENGIPILYAKAMAYHLTGEARYAEEVAGILESIMSHIRTVDWEVQGRQCQLNFSWGIPELVGAADLVEGYWAERTCQGPASPAHDDQTIAAGPCKRLFQNWLAKLYYGVSYTAAGSMNNWGVAATNACAHIADYLWDRPELRLVHRQPDEVDGRTEIALSPAAAWSLARRTTLDRMNGYRVDYIQDKTCDDFANESGQHDPARPPVKSQITERGIVPDDARRGEFCNIERYNGEYQGYPQLHVSLYVQHCELLWRRGDRACYDNVDLTDLPAYGFPNPNDTQVQQTTHLYPGRGSVERAIKALIVDSGTEWRHDAALAVAYHYYVTHSTLSGIEAWPAQIDPAPRCWQDVCFGTLTHGLAPDEAPAPPPTVPPPTDP